MQTNQLPKYDASDNPTDCCPRFKPEGWDGQALHFEDKLFVKAQTRGLFHIPINMGRVFAKTFAYIEQAGALDYDDYIVMSHDPSPWKAEHYFAVSQTVPEQEMVKLSGDFLTRVFEGPYKDTPKWQKTMQAEALKQGKMPKKTYFFYTTCPKCAKTYQENYVVGVTEVQ